MTGNHLININSHFHIIIIDKVSKLQGVFNMEYLAKLTRQIAIDRLRSRKSIKRKASEYSLSLSELSDTFSCGDGVEDAFDAELLREAIGKFLLTIPKEARVAFLGRYYYFDSLKEVAAYCGMKESKLKSLLYRTRQNLRDYLIKEGFDL